MHLFLFGFLFCLFVCFYLTLFFSHFPILVFFFFTLSLYFICCIQLYKVYELQASAASSITLIWSKQSYFSSADWKDLLRVLSGPPLPPVRLTKLDEWGQVPGYKLNMGSKWGFHWLWLFTRSKLSVLRKFTPPSCALSVRTRDIPVEVNSLGSCERWEKHIALVLSWWPCRVYLDVSPFEVPWGVLSITKLYSLCRRLSILSIGEKSLWPLNTLCLAKDIKRDRCASKGCMLGLMAVQCEME